MMKILTKSCLLALAISFTLLGYACQPTQNQNTNTGGANMSAADPALATKISQFAPTEVTADVSHLSDGDRKALDKIIQAAKLMDPIFYRQVWSGNVALKAKLEADKSPLGQQRLHYFVVNKGPWSRPNQDEPFIPDVPHEKPPQAGFYPDDIKKDEFNTWAQGLSEDDRKKAQGFFTVIRRGADGKLTIVPYSQEYREFLEPAANLLREAASLTTNETLKNFLTKRADAFMSDNYYASDVAWMDLNAPIDVTFGPYETYEDGLFGYKAAFEAFVTLRDEAESTKIAKFSSYLQELENNLPMDPRYRNPKVGAGSPIRVVDVVFTAGDGNRGVQTAAFNLPNDEQVVKEKGTTQIMLKNMQEEKFNKVLVPIAGVALDPAQRSQISFDAFFTHILAHELLHGIGPHSITVAGRQTTVRLELKELASAIEEAKADITGLWGLQYLIDKGAVDKKLENDLYTTYLSSSFRSVRFGITEAHGKGQAMQFNYLLDEGGIKYDAQAGTYAIDPARIKDAVRKLTTEILTLQAEGSYEKAKALLDKYGVIRPEMQKTLDKLSAVPIDIEPRFTLAESK
jgi:hypothetical protein